MSRAGPVDVRAVAERGRPAAARIRVAALAKARPGGGSESGPTFHSDSASDLRVGRRASGAIGGPVARSHRRPTRSPGRRKPEDGRTARATCLSIDLGASYYRLA
jgi:hypothetical protein